MTAAAKSGWIFTVAMPFQNFFLRAAAATLLVFAAGIAGASARDTDSPPAGPVLKVGGVQFIIPSRWIAEPVESPARVGQWRVPAPRGADATMEGHAVLFYFGAGLGGTPQENIDAWKATMLDASGHPAAGELKTRMAGVFKISELVCFGSYSDPAPIAGLPPAVRPGYGLAAAVVENPQGNLYWRLTGPQTLVTATLPLFRKIVDGVKPQGGG